jgi:antitoxin component YwqK of YwqJK toxin-antitoxin module
MSVLKKCTQILKSGVQCSRNSKLNSKHCWQHSENKLSTISQNNESEISIYLEEISQLPTDITKNVLSDYIDYDRLLQIIKYSENFKVNLNRIQIKEQINENKDIIKEIYIDGDLRNIEIFNKDSIKIVENNYKNREYEGKQYRWYKNGKLDYKSNYKNGKLEGVQYNWYDNGKLKSVNNYKDGNPEGKQYNWYENGQLHYDSNYKNDEKEGKHYYWYENGQLHYDSNYKNDEKEGKHYYWYENGQLHLEENYKNGILEGKQYWWYENGQLESESNYKNGKAEGLQFYWDKNSRLKSESNYKNDIKL